MNAISYDDRKKVYQIAYEKYGIGAQIVIAVEEMSELTKEICKISRGQGNMSHLAEEIADVTIMMEQLRLMYDINDEVCDYMNAKVQRLQNRLLEV